MKSRKLCGRRPIYTDVKEITKDNIVDVLHKAMEVHQLNRGEIEYLENYRNGEQPIWKKRVTKKTRPEINNVVIENRADEIVSFKVGYQVGEPLQYVCLNTDAVVSDDFRLFNKYVLDSGKASKDLSLFDSIFTAGLGYRMILPNKSASFDESPFVVHTLDAKDTFVVKYNGLGKPDVLGVNYITRADNTNVYGCYTDKMFFKVVGDKVVEATPHILGNINIIPYVHGSSMLGAFETVITILDAINNVGSNRIDAIEQFVQAVMVFKNVKLVDDEHRKLKDAGAIEIEGEGDIKYIIAELNQMQTQALVDYMYQTVLTICGMPNRNGGSSTSDTGSAVIMRDGWEAAEARAKLLEPLFKESERRFLKIAIKITNVLRGTNLSASDIDTRFTRRNYENITQKAQVLDLLLKNPDIHPKLAFEHSGMFVDPERAFAISEAYAKQRKKEQLEEAMKYSQQFVDSNKSKVNSTEGDNNV